METSTLSVLKCMPYYLRRRTSQVLTCALSELRSCIFIQARLLASCIFIRAKPPVSMSGLCILASCIFIRARTSHNFPSVPTSPAVSTIYTHGTSSSMEYCKGGYLHREGGVYQYQVCTLARWTNKSPVQHHRLRNQ